MPYGGSQRTKSIWKIATAQAKRSGYATFKSGSAGDAKRKRIADAIDRKGKGKSFGFGR